MASTRSAARRPQFPGETAPAPRGLRRWAGALVAAVLAAASACNCDAPCTPGCPAAGDTRCQGAQVETCGAGATACLAWSAPAPCGHQQTCTGTTCAACPAATACPQAGTTRCSGPQVETCATDATGCLAWSTPAPCGNQQTCTGTACAACPGANACASAGLTRCSGLQFETCVAGADGCLAWAAPASCGSQQYCAGGACTACALATSCADAGAGATRCASDTEVETCGADPNGCLAWSAPASCGGTRLCSGASCAALYLYAAGSASGTFGFSLDPTTGALAELPGSPYAAPGNRVLGHPSGRFLYVSDENTAKVAAYALHADGSLSPVGTALATGGQPEAPAISPDGRYLYLGCVSGGGTGVYAIDPATGGLTAAPLLAWGNYNHGVAFHPSGGYVYVSRNNANDVTRFAYDAGTGVASDPRTLAAAGGYHAAIDPQGRFLYVSDWDKGGNRVSSYSLSPTDGTLTRVGDFLTGGATPAGVAVTADGRHLYVVNYGSGTLSGFSVGGGADAGALTPVSGSPFAVAPAGAVWELSVDPRGKFVFVGHGGGLSAFVIDPATGSLSDGGVLSVRTSTTTVGASTVVPVPQ